MVHITRPKSEAEPLYSADSAQYWPVPHDENHYLLWTYDYEKFAKIGHITDAMVINRVELHLRAEHFVSQRATRNT